MGVARRRGRSSPRERRKGSRRAQQDEGVGERLEPGLDPRLQRGARLGVVVVHERDGEQRVFRDQACRRRWCAGRSRCPSARRAKNWKCSGTSNSRMVPSTLLEVGRELADVGRPVLADGKQLAAPEVGAQVVEPVLEERGGDVLERVEPEAIDAGRVDEPAAKLEQLVAHLLVVDVDVAAHQVVEVALLEAHVAREGLVGKQVQVLRSGRARRRCSRRR